MQSLPLAVKIADVVAAARRRKAPLDVEAHVQQLLKDHPEARASHAEIAETLREESAVLGIERVGS